MSNGLPAEGARFMRKVDAQHRSHEMRARLDHGASNTGILNIISWSKGTLLTSSVQAERKGYRLPHLLRRSNISYPVFRPFCLLSFFLHVNRNFTCPNEQCMPRRPDFRWIRLKIYTGRGSAKMLELTRWFFFLLGTLHGNLMPRIHDCTISSSSYTAKSSYLSRIPLTSCSVLWVSSLHWEPPTGP